MNIAEPIQAYEVIFEMVYQTEEGLRGKNLTMLFVAPSTSVAVDVAVYWCKGRLEALADFHKDAQFGAIKVGRYQIGGYISEKVQFDTSRALVSFFEWKRDYPDSLEAYVDAFKKKEGEPPYLMSQTIETHAAYNPNYGDDRTCKCGHPYYRHFDTYEDMKVVGCKYCECSEFREATWEDACEACKGEGDVSVQSRHSGGTTKSKCSRCGGSGIDPDVSKEWIS